MNSTALLISGSNNQLLVAEAQKQISVDLCPRKKADNDCACPSCDKVRRHQHHLVRWFSPEKQYLVDDIDQVRSVASLLLAEGDVFFFVFEHADRLGPAAGNRLLKTVEEPPPGFRFIFLTTNPDDVLLTIASRCSHKNLDGKSPEEAQHPILSHFLSEVSHSTLAEFGYALKSEETNHIASKALLDKLVLCFTIRYKNALIQGQANHVEQLASVLKLLHSAQRRPPAAGGPELFWKQLYLAFSVLRDAQKTT